MTACARCQRSVLRRHRCHICLRLCCSECLEWPGSGMGRTGIRWCDKRVGCVAPATLAAMRTELRAVDDRIDALYWTYTRTKRGKPPVVVAPELYTRRSELRRLIREAA